MAKNSFDQFSKQLLEEVLALFGTVETSYEVPGEPQWVDVYFIPTKQSAFAPSPLGLLGRLVQTTCLIEPFRRQPTTAEVRSCLLKLFQVQGGFRRQARRDATSIPDTALPFLWILASSASEGLLQQFEAIAAEDWPLGIYFLPLALRTAIIAINQLPCEDETLWLRLLGKGQTQQTAITEVLAFDTGDPRRLSILRLLANWKINLEVTQQIEAQEEELLMALSQAYLEWEQQTEQRGRQEEGLSFVFRLLPHRIGAIPPEAEAQIRTLSLAQLEELGEALLDFTQPSDLRDWLRSH